MEMGQGWVRCHQKAQDTDLPDTPIQMLLAAMGLALCLSKHQLSIDIMATAHT